ncbi:LuxR C-terminal-related transcriptional regulator [Kutzneria kofuensis]|uniref:Tetratricopeptide (TPR) repeat protein n=2 Tax=Kutzneria kofuensis TaxID=103725 RepID=A0A7W9KPG3_9PSEU|nr:tetratricopeptide (TPR) repeat protein [Kutzneria kofuensis]
MPRPSGHTPEGEAGDFRDLVVDIVDKLRMPGRPLVVLSGPAGAELSRALSEMRSCAEEQGLTTVNLPFSENTPLFHLADRIPSFEDRRNTPTLLVVEEIQRVAAAAVGGLEGLVRQLAATGTRSLCTVALPLPSAVEPAMVAMLARLRRDGLAEHVRLRPLPPRRLDALVTGAIGAKPAPELAALLWRATRGWPATVTAALRIMREHDLVRFVDRHAFLGPVDGAPHLPDSDALVLPIRRMGRDVWAAAKAAAVFGPLGDAAPRLVGDALGVPESEARRLLAGLEAAGVLRFRRAQRTWSFRPPLLGFALRWVLGPYERHRMAQVAVSAVWAGEAPEPDARYLADLLMSAGRMAPADRAKDTLLAIAGRRSFIDTDRAVRWLRAAADLSSDTQERAQILLTQARLCLARGTPLLALESSQALLLSLAGQLTPGQLLEVYFVHLTALHEAGETAVLERIADEGWLPGPGGQPHRSGFRLLALVLLNRWRQARDLLAADDLDPAFTSLRALVRLWFGEPAEFENSAAALAAGAGDPRQRPQQACWYAGALLTLGELGRAEQLLAETGLAAEHLRLPGRVLVAAERGRFDEALELARKSIATGPPFGSDVGQAGMYQVAATILASRGKLARARELLAAGRAGRPALGHLLAVPEALIEVALGRTAQARAVLREALDQAEDDGLVVHTDVLWTALADLAVRTGCQEEVPQCLREVELVAKQMGTGRAELNRLALLALVDKDPKAAEAGIDLARRRGQPMELASLLERLVRYGVADPALLAEAYDLLGGLDALMSRAWLRNTMRCNGISIPGRQATVAENERLLAVLVAEGLGNKQIATALQASEKSVEGRLSRLFARTGYHCRVELATAMLSGQFTG